MIAWLPKQAGFCRQRGLRRQRFRQPRPRPVALLFAWPGVIIHWLPLANFLFKRIGRNSNSLSLLYRLDFAAGGFVPSNTDLTDSSTNLRRERVATAVVRFCWWVQAAAIVSTLVWISVDGQFAFTVHNTLRSFTGLLLSDGAYAPFVQPTTGTCLLGLLVVFTLASLAGIAIGLFRGSRTHRRLRSWFALTALIAAWLAVIVGWRDLGWLAQQQRLKFQLESFDKIASSLAVNWPRDDGQRNDLGTFMAYPIGQPTMLMVIAPTISENSPPVISVEKTSDGVIHFELGGSETGVWLEHHPANQQPHSFTGGLLINYRLVKSAPLTGGWFLCQYDATAAQPDHSPQMSQPRS